MSGCNNAEIWICHQQTHGHIGASPDRIMYDPSESSPGVVEMKYLQVKEGKVLEDVLLRQHICVKTNNGLSLNRNHKYFHHLKQQMFVTTYHWDIFVACCQGSRIYVEKELFDQEFWSPVLSKLDLFFDSVILPELAFHVWYYQVKIATYGINKDLTWYVHDQCCHSFRKLPYTLFQNGCLFNVLLFLFKLASVTYLKVKYTFKFRAKE